MVIYTICIVVDANKSFIAQKQGSKKLPLNEEYAHIELARKGCFAIPCLINCSDCIIYIFDTFVTIMLYKFIETFDYPIICYTLAL